MSTISTPPTQAPSGHTANKQWLALPAALGLLAFYTLNVLALCWILILLAADLVLAVGLARVGLTSLLTPSISALWQLMIVLLRSLSLKKSEDHTLPLEREAAPEIHDRIAELARRVGVPAPSRISLYMGNGAWVNLKGYSQRGRTTVGIGYDLLCILGVDEFEAVMGHELAHAKLVGRGFRGWLLKGLQRISQQGQALSAVNAAAKNSKTSHYTSKLLEQCTTGLGKYLSRLAGALSRRDEFDADNLGAKVSSISAAKSALFKSHICDFGEGFTWSQRATRIEQGRDLPAWLRDHLLPRDEETWRIRVQKALATKRTSEYDTHPPLAERVAALCLLEPVGATANPVAPPFPSPPAHYAVNLLSDPAATVAHLQQFVEASIHREELRHSREAQKFIRKTYRKSGSRTAGLVLIILSVGLMFLMPIGLLTTENKAEAIESLFSVGAFLMLGAGLGLCLYFSSGKHFARRKLPVPSLEDWDEGLKRIREFQATENSGSSGDGENPVWLTKLEQELQKLVPTGVKSHEIREFWTRTCYDALERCDYRRAWVAGNMALHTKDAGAEIRLSTAVAAAAFGNEAGLGQLAEMVRHTGMGHSLNWTISWIYCLLEAWQEAEPYLIDALREREGECTVHALLAKSQRARHKMVEATLHARRAVELKPESVRARVLLTEILLELGHARSAGEHLEWLRQHAPQDREGALCRIAWLGLQDDSEAAAQAAHELSEQDSNPQTRIDIARILADYKLNDAAHEQLVKVTDSHFAPEALVLLASLAYRNNAHDTARDYLVRALDVTREAFPNRISQINYFSSVFEILREIDARNGIAEHEEPTPVPCQARLVTMDLGNWLAKEKVSQLQLLVCHPHEATAHDLGGYIARAMFPTDSQALAISVILADPEQQPDEPITPGIYGHRWL